jgi:hypothetical protein
MTQFLARRNHLGNYKLLADGHSFGTLYVNEGKPTGGWFRDRDVSEAFKRIRRNTPGDDVRTVLLCARRAWEVVSEDARREAEAEAESQRIVDRHFENRMSDEDKAREDEEYANDPWLQDIERRRAEAHEQYLAFNGYTDEYV